MKSKIITVSENVEVDVNLYDYEDKIMELISDEELLFEVEDRGLLEETSNTNIINKLQNMQSYEFKRILCDIVGLSYHASNEEIINLLKEKL